MIIDKNNFSIVGIKPNFWKVDKCNAIIKNYSDNMVMFN